MKAAHRPAVQPSRSSENVCGEAPRSYSDVVCLIGEARKQERAMKMRLTPLLPVCLMSVIGLGTMAAMAASYTDVDKCQMLIRDFRRDSYFSAGPEVEDAKKIRDEAAEL